MAMVKLMLAVEVEFDLSIPGEDLNPENFGSIDAVEALVGRLTAILYFACLPRAAPPCKQ
jgi:acyl carrier protein